MTEVTKEMLEKMKELNVDPFNRVSDKEQPNDILNEVDEKHGNA